MQGKIVLIVTENEAEGILNLRIRLNMFALMTDGLTSADLKCIEDALTKNDHIALFKLLTSIFERIESEKKGE